MPALSLGQAGPYVAGAYLAFLGLVLVYVAIMAGRLSRLERELENLAALARRAGGEPPDEDAAP
jgi:hypothetical protein